LRHVVSLAAEARAGGKHLGRVEAVRQQSPGQVLRADPRGPEAAGPRGAGMASHGGPDGGVSRAARGGDVKRLRELFSRTKGAMGGGLQDGELSEELRSHIEMATAENIRRGMKPEEARRRAMIESGGMTQAAEAVRDQRGLPVVEALVADVRYAFR